MREEVDAQVSLSGLSLLDHVTSPFVRTTQQISLGILLTVVRPVKYVSRMIFTNLNIIWSPLVNA